MMETITNMIYHAQMGLCNTTMLLRWFRWFHLYNYSFLKAIFVVFFGKSNAALDITYVQKFTKSTSINPNDSYWNHSIILCVQFNYLFKKIKLMFGPS